MGTSVMELMNEYTKAISGAATLAADGQIKALKNDKTILATIIDDSDWENGAYECMYQNGTLKAYSIRDEHYEKNTVVYVQVPQSDFDKQKFIIGKQVNKDENEIYNYEFVFENFVKLKKYCDIEGNFNYRANQSEDDLDEEDQPWQNVISYAAVNNSSDTGMHGEMIVGDLLGVSMIVQSELGSWSPSAGNFGIEIILDGYTRSTDEHESVFKQTRYLFDKYHMYGNIYAYTFPVEQQVAFDISEYATIVNLSVNFWQDCNFIDEYSELINWTNEGGSKVPPNIHIKNIQVYTGYTKSELSGNKLFLYSYDSLLYGEDPKGVIPRSDLDVRSLAASLVYYNAEKASYEVAQTMDDLEDMGAQLYWYIRDEKWSADSVTNSIFQDDGTPQPDWVEDRHGYGGTFWAPISLSQSFPSIVTDHDETIYNKISARFQCDLNKSKYQFKVVAVIGQDVVVSDVLTFTNAIDTEGLNNQLALNDTVILRPAIFLSTLEGGVRILYPDDQFQNFYVYDENNRVLYTDDKREFQYNGYTLMGLDNVPYSSLEFFLELWVKANVFGLAEETADEYGYVRVSNWKTNATNQYQAFTVDWDLPPSSYTMLDIHDLSNAYTTEAYYNLRDNYQVNWIGDNSNNIETLFDVDKMTTKVFTIRDQYDMQRIQNTVSCTLTRNGQSYTAKRTFYFGRAMAQGCDYTPIIEIEIPAGNTYLVANASFKMNCYVIDRYGTPIEDYTVEWTFLGNEPTWSEVDAGTQHSISGYVNSVEPFVVTATVTGPVEWPIYARRGIMVTDSPTFLVNNNVFCPSRVEFNSTGQAPHYATQDFECRTINASNELDEYFYPTWQLHARTEGFKDIVHLVQEPVYKTKYYLVQPNDLYNERYQYVYVDIDMCYHNLDKYSEDVLTLFNQYKNNNILFRAVVESYAKYYNLSGGVDTEFAPPVYRYHLNYEPGGADAIQGGVDSVWQWQEGYGTNEAYFTWLSFNWVEDVEINGETTQQRIQVTQAIAYDRTLYPSSLVNEWDGKSLSLDYENNAIMATMIAAGTKNIKNQFTGVMMGNWVAHGDSSFDSPEPRSNASGLYGLNNGAFTFAFLDDGTGYIGPAGRGRIQFDGNNALISNSTKTCYLNLNPNKIIEEGIDYRGTKWYANEGLGISQYFLYCQVPVDSTLLNDSSDDESKFRWAQDFVEDDDNNYFIVDPSHGAMISGGIISKYGRIGNWYINSHGLYQKYVSEESYINGEFVGSSKNRFVYLGMPGIKQEDLTRVKNTYDALLAANEQARLDRINGTGDTELSAMESLMRDLGQYMRKDLMTIDVYHYYTSSLALQMFIDYVEPEIKKYKLGEYSLESEIINYVYSPNNMMYSKNGIFKYDNINQYLHNHYSSSTEVINNKTFPAGTRKTGIQGLFPNIQYVMGFNRSSMTTGIPYIYYISPTDILYQYYENRADTSSTYYTINQIGDIRVYSYDPDYYDSRMSSNINNLLNNYSVELGTSAGQLNHDKVSQTAMNGHWWEPTLHPNDTDGSIKNMFWHNGQWYTVTNPPQIYLCKNGINLSGLEQWITTTKIYLYYAVQQYNQVLYRQLEVGLNDLEARKNNSAEDLFKYNTAMNIVNSYGGMEAIKNTGLSNIMPDTQEQGTELTEEQKERIRILKEKAINEEFDDKARLIKLQRARAIAQLYNEEDEHKYAMYVGHNSPIDLSAQNQTYLDPLFGVKWDGYMVARQGRIGHDSPWYISDVGLTQKNNFGIIYLGDPSQDGDPDIYTQSVNLNSESVSQGKRVLFHDDRTGEVLSADNGYLLPNGSTINGKKAKTSTTDQSHDESDGYYLGRTYYIGDSNAEVWNQNVNYPYSNNMLKYLGPEAFDEYGNFAMYAGTDSDGIRFGVRMDGTVYCSRLQAVGIRIVGGDISGALTTNTENRYGWPQSSTSTNGINEVSYTVSSDTEVANFVGLEFGCTIRGGGTIYVYKGLLEEDRAAQDGNVTTASGQTKLCVANQLYQLRVLDNSGKRQNEVNADFSGTKVTISDSQGIRYYYYDSTNNKWIVHTSGFASYSTHTNMTNAEAANYIGGHDAILLGGKLEGWLIQGDKLYIRRNIPDSNGNNAWLYSILLDGATNSIQVADGQIFLDGTNGILFMGKPSINSGFTSFTTNSHMIMSNINITSTTIGLTSYTISTIGTSQTSTVDVTTTTTTTGSSHSYGGTVVSGSVNGATTISQLVVTSDPVTNDNSITYGGGFYTICYDQSNLLDTPKVTNNEFDLTTNGKSGIGIAFEDSVNGHIALYPFGDDSQLGLSFTYKNVKYNHRWNIYATKLIASQGIWLERVSNGAVTYDPVICKAAFDETVDAINQIMRELGGGIDGLAGTVAGLGTDVDTALGGSLKDIRIDTEYTETAANFILTAIKYNNTTIVSNQFSAARLAHGHQFTLTLSGASLTGRVSVISGYTDGNACSLADITGLNNYYAKTETYTKDEIDTLIEKTFKNGWNAAINAITVTVNNSTMSTSCSGTSSDSASGSISISVSGGDGKNSYGRAINLSMSHTHAEATPGHTCQSTGGGYYRPCQGTDPGAVWLNTSSLGTPNIKSASWSQASISIIDGGGVVI